MNKLRSFFNRNMRTIIVVVLFIVFIIIIIQVLDHFAKLDKEKQENSINVSNNYSTKKPNQSAISDYEVYEGIYEAQKNIVSEFVEYCNNKEVQKAYELLSTDCKNELYPTIQDFEQNYYNNIFSSKRTYSMQNWTGWIYIVRYTEDILSTGKVTDNSTIQDYIKIVIEDGNEKLNINSYLGKKEINKEKEYQNIKIKVLDRRSYMDYEIYDFEVENNNDNKLILNSADDSIYLVDSKGTKHYAINNELDNDSMIIKSKHKTKISIKFDNPYISEREINKITFENIVLGYGVKSINNFSIDL